MRVRSVLGPVLAVSLMMMSACQPAETAITASGLAAVQAMLGNSPQSDPAKQRSPKPTPTQSGDDSCRWANDRECDEPDIGTGACPMGTDFSDCRALREGENDSCRWANDGECDDPGLGTGACVQGTDLTDCRNIASLRNRNDSCVEAFNGICDEPGGPGSGRCAARTDRRDCVGAERPMTINDHFFGRDERVFVDQAGEPWRLVGHFRSQPGGTCTATLVGPDVVLTAAHCIHDEAQLDARGTFDTAVGLAGGPYTANVVAYFIQPGFDYQRYISTDEIDGQDWALLRLDRRLGDTLGYLQVEGLGREEALSSEIFQAGYSWDTGENLSAHLGCRIVRVYDDNTFQHQCDTTRGDSGSPFMVRRGDSYAIIGVDSNFRAQDGGPTLNIAAAATGFARYVPDFVAGRIGNDLGRSGQFGGAKPKDFTVRLPRKDFDTRLGR